VFLCTGEFLWYTEQTNLHRLSFQPLSTAEDSLTLVHGKTCLALGSSTSFFIRIYPLSCHLNASTPHRSLATSEEQPVDDVTTKDAGSLLERSSDEKEWADRVRY
jgi:hypothetical protein